MQSFQLPIEAIIRFVIFLSVVIGAILTKEVIQPLYLLLMLLFILNTQLRNTFLKGKAYSASLILDTAFIAYCGYIFNGYTYILFYITIMNILLYTEAIGKKLIMLLNLCSLMYFLLGASVEVKVLNLVVVLILYILLSEYRKLKEKICKVEDLYDENRRYSYQMETAKKRLEEYSRRVEQLAQVEERQRISTEIHDTIGHRLTAILMQLEATSKVIELKGEEGLVMLSEVREHLRQSLDILRATVKNIRAKEYSGIISIQEFLEECRATTGVNITYDIYGSPYKLVPISEITIFKNLQEAITNSIRHGVPSNIKVSLTYAPKEIILSVKDDGKGAANIVKGMGLSGMEERVSLLGGSVRFCNELGFEVISSIPVN